MFVSEPQKARPKIATTSHHTIRERGRQAETWLHPINNEGRNISMKTYTPIVGHPNPSAEWSKCDLLTV